MNISLFAKLFSENLLSEEEFEKINQYEKQPLSVHWDLRTLLYLGILLLTTALSILVYKNINTIGHDVVIIFIALVCIICFGYCFKNAKGYSRQKIESPNLLFDYILLLGCLLLVTFIGYIQFQYNVFGNHWGLAAFIPAVLLFIAAYYFDHLGVLSLAITNLAAWIGITVTPLSILRQNDFESNKIIFSGMALGAFLVGLSRVITNRNHKSHFGFTYKNFGTHILFISLLAALFHFDDFYLVSFIFIIALSFVYFKNAMEEKSFYFLVSTVGYFYIALSYFVIHLLTNNRMYGEGNSYAIILYFITSGIGLIWLLIHYNKILKKDDRL